MEKYFDAFLYLANWGTHVLELRLPSRLLDPATAKAYCSGDSASSARSRARSSSLSCRGRGSGDWVEGEGQLSSLISVRPSWRAATCGALRRLAPCVQSGELDDEDPEPPVPPDSGSSAPLWRTLPIPADRRRPPACRRRGKSTDRRRRDRRDEVRAWVGKLVTREKDELITGLVLDADHAQIAELLQRSSRSARLATAAPRPRENRGPATPSSRGLHDGARAP